MTSNRGQVAAPERFTFTVVPWGPCNTGELENAIIRASALQSSFNFRLYSERLPAPQESLISVPLASPPLDKGYDLDEAVAWLAAQPAFQSLFARPIILVTSLPYTEPGVEPGTNIPVTNALDPFYFYDNRLNSLPNVSIVSTFVWDRLPADPNIPAFKGDLHRPLEPYALYSLGAIAAGTAGTRDIGHRSTKMCPFDYCFRVRDIDQFFVSGYLCQYCWRQMDSAAESGSMTDRDLVSILQIFQLALGDEWPTHLIQVLRNVAELSRRPASYRLWLRGKPYWITSRHATFLRSHPWVPIIFIDDEKSEVFIGGRRQDFRGRGQPYQFLRALARHHGRGMSGPELAKEAGDEEWSMEVSALLKRMLATSKGLLTPFLQRPRGTRTGRYQLVPEVSVGLLERIGSPEP